MKSNLNKHSLLARRLNPCLRPALGIGFLLLLPVAAHATTVFIKTLSDSGPGSLRGAITFANTHPGSTIAFAVKSTALQRGVAVLRPLTLLPAIRAEGTRIDGTSQARFIGNTNPAGPEIVLDGSRVNSQNSSVGLRILAPHCRVSALVIQGWQLMGIGLSGSRAFGNRVTGCYIGTDEKGQKAVPNGSGLLIGDGAHDNVIGGTKPGERNVISGNGPYGIAMFGTRVTGNRIEGCLVGTDRTGQKPLPNDINGIFIGKARTITWWVAW